MKVLFEIGDKIYKSDYDDVTFMEMQKMATEFCVGNNLSLEEKEDEKGYFLVIACKEGEGVPENLEAAKTSKKSELKYCKEELEFSPVEYGGFSYDVDELSLLRINSLISSLGERKISFVDSDGCIHHDFGKKDLIEILNVYCERLIALENVYSLLKNKVDKCYSVDEVREINTDDFFMI